MSNNIKGGGRAPLSDEAEQALISLLLSIREGQSDFSSEHARKREHKRFVKRLVARHERRSLAQKLNVGGSNSAAVDSTTSTSNQPNTAPKSQTAGASTYKPKKVRMELCEATFHASSNKSSSKSTDNKSSKGSGDFKIGNTKVMVLMNDTPVEELLKEAKNKLKMKKKPTRCFVVEKKISMDIDNLRGIKDGDKIYVTSHDEDSSKEKASKGKTGTKDEIAENEDDGDNDNEPEIDPLEAVKQAYVNRKRLRKKKTAGDCKKVMTHPRLQDFFHQLPLVSPERAKLPATAVREKILAELDSNRVLVVCGATGCGKSTQIPQFLHEGMVASGYQNHHILVSQPRRVAAISLAQRVAMEMNSAPPGKAGSLVGYSVRLDRAVSDSAKIVFCTVGILLRMLVCPKETTGEFEEDSSESNESIQHTPLANLTHVVIDEVHERDVNTDFVLTLLRQVLTVNKNIRVILMSATASADLFVRYFEEVGMKPNVIEIPGRTFHVAIRWISECERFASSHVQGWSQKNASTPRDNDSKHLSPWAADKIDNKFILKLIQAIIRKQQSDGQLPAPGSQRVREDGAILVFLPGKGEIEGLAKVLYEDPLVGDRGMCKILKLHSTIPKGQQESVFQPAVGGSVKIILSTNLAETSLTIPDVSHVIDCGRVKELQFNHSSRIKELVTVWTSRASAKQRAGRAGRTGPGICWRIYSETFANESMLDQTSPEMLRTPLDELIMQVALLYEHKRDERKKTSNSEPSAESIGFCPIRFLAKTPEPPSEEALVEATKHLLEVGALAVVATEPRLLYRLTPLGYHLARLPIDAKVGKVLLVGCILGCLQNSLTIAAALSITKNCFPSRWGGMSEVDWKICLQSRQELVEKGFGGPNWRGGTVKGDLIATIAAFRKWHQQRNEGERRSFCAKHGIDNVAMNEIESLSSQFMDCLKDAGFVSDLSDSHNDAKDDALLCSCCLVAGLYPNVATLMRPRRGGPKGGRLITKDGNICKISSGSFQVQRLRNAAENGKDAYAVFHSKHRSIGTNDKPAEVFLSEVDFVSRFALLLFGGDLVVEKNALIVDGWLKFKVGDKGTAGAVLIQELRGEIDNLMLGYVGGAESITEKWKKQREDLIGFVRQLLADE